MSDLDRLTTKIDSLEQKHDESTSRLESAITKMSESIETFVAFQARAEERHDNSSKRLDKIETKVEKLWDMVHKNSLVVNGVVAVVTALIIWFLRGIIGG